ncbi:MAG: hypothetical protein QXH60_00685 [Candidatus Pacearchaeota archaeon]
MKKHQRKINLNQRNKTKRSNILSRKYHELRINQFKKNIVDYEKLKNDILEEYSINLDRAKVNIKIEKTNEGIKYKILIPEIEPGTNALLDEIRRELISVASISVGEIID